MISYEQSAYERAELIITEFDSASKITTSGDPVIERDPYEGGVIG